MVRRSGVWRSQTRVVSGRHPLIRLARDGAQTACWQYVRSKTVPRAARRSMFGDRTVRSPKQPSRGLRSSTAMKRTFIGFFAAARAPRPASIAGAKAPAAAPRAARCRKCRRVSAGIVFSLPSRHREMAVTFSCT